jgi:hypothetical protein
MSFVEGAELLPTVYAGIQYVNGVPRAASTHRRSRQLLIDPLNASWPESNRHFAYPLSWSWTRRHQYARAAKKGTVVCTKT